jgi:hypothetical protein
MRRTTTEKFAGHCDELGGMPFAKGCRRMLRITPQSDERASMRVEGQLVGPWVEELRRSTVGAGLVAGGFLDLRHLTFADAEGVALLRQLRAAGTELGDCSEFLAALIGGEERAG